MHLGVRGLRVLLNESRAQAAKRGGAWLQLRCFRIVHNVTHGFCDLFSSLRFVSVCFYILLLSHAHGCLSHKPFLV